MNSKTPNSELVYRQFMLAVEAIANGQGLSDWLADRCDLGRKFRIDEALMNASNHLKGPALEEHEAVILQACEVRGLTNSGDTVTKVAEQLLRSF